MALKGLFVNELNHKTNGGGQRTGNSKDEISADAWTTI